MTWWSLIIYALDELQLERIHQQLLQTAQFLIWNICTGIVYIYAHIRECNRTTSFWNILHLVVIQYIDLQGPYFLRSLCLSLLKFYFGARYLGSLDFWEYETPSLKMSHTRITCIDTLTSNAFPEPQIRIICRLLQLCVIICWIQRYVTNGFLFYFY